MVLPHGKNPNMQSDNQRVQNLHAMLGKAFEWLAQLLSFARSDGVNRSMCTFFGLLPFFLAVAHCRQHATRLWHTNNILIFNYQ